MNAGFLSLPPGESRRILHFMARLYAGTPQPYDLERAAGACEWLLDHPESGGLWVIQADGRDAGYLVLTLCASIEFRGPFAMLDELYVDEPFRGRGLGAAAVEFASAWARARGLAALRLETAHDNTRAQGLYTRGGFRLHDRYLMTKWL